METTVPSPRQPMDHGLLATILLLHVALFWWAGPLLYGSDDLGYALLAQQIRQGIFTFQPHHFSHRLGVLSPTALIYALFDVSLYSTAALSLFSSLLTIAAVHGVAWRLLGRLPAHLAALLLATNSFQVQQVLYLGPDILISCCTFAGVALLQAARQDDHPARRRPWALAVTAVFILGFLTKLTIVWVFMFVFLLMVSDVVQRRHLRLWGWICLAGVLFGVFYLALYQLLREDPLYRLHVMEAVANNPGSPWVFSEGSGKSLLHRLTYQPLLLVFATSGYVTLFLVGLPMAGPALRASYPRGEGLVLWVSLVLFGLLSFWFATSSFKFYNPIALYDRHILFLLPPLAVLGGGVLALLMQPRRHLLAARMALAALLLLLVLHLLGNWKRELLLLELPLLLLAGVPWWSRLLRLDAATCRTMAAGVLVLVLPAMPAWPILQGQLGSPSFFTIQQQLVVQLRALEPRPTRLYTDPHLGEIVRFLFHFRLPDHLTIQPWPTLPREMAQTAPARVLILLSPRHTRRTDLMDRRTPPPASWTRLWQVETGDQEALYLYEVADPATLFKE